MKHKEGNRRVGKWLWWLLSPIFASTRFLLLAFFLSAGSMLVSYTVVQYLIRDLSVRKDINPVVLHRANDLRGYSNDLAELCNGYARRIPIDATRISPQARQWLEKVFRPEIQYLQYRMNDTIVQDLREFSQLTSTVARCASMARHPDDTALRARALREAAESVASVETWIAAQGMSKRLSRPAIRIRYE